MIKGSKLTFTWPNGGGVDLQSADTVTPRTDPKSYLGVIRITIDSFQIDDPIVVHCPMHNDTNSQTFDLCAFALSDFLTLHCQRGLWESARITGSNDESLLNYSGKDFKVNSNVAHGEEVQRIHERLISIWFGFVELR
jgi:hypothetical protein